MTKTAELFRIDWMGVLLHFVQQFADSFFPNDELFNAARAALLRRFGLKLGRRCRLGRRAVFLHRRNFTAGDRVYINHEAFFDCYRPVRIGHYCEIGYRAVLITAAHEPESRFDGARRPLSGEKSGPITLEEYAWIGANAVILPGVRVGRGAVVAAGAVVTRDVEPGTLVAGVPARKIKTLERRGAGA